MNNNGITHIKPKIKTIDFPGPDKMSISLSDGREVIIPLSFFPDIQALSPEERKDWVVYDDELFTFESKNCHEIFHLEQVLGRENEYSYHFPN